MWLEAFGMDEIVEWRRLEVMKLRKAYRLREELLVSEDEN